MSNTTPTENGKKGAAGGIAGLALLMVAGLARYCDDIGRFAVTHVDDVAVHYGDDVGRLATQADEAARAAGQQADDLAKFEEGVASAGNEAGVGDVGEDLGEAAREVGRAAAEEALQAAGGRGSQERRHEFDLKELKCRTLNPAGQVRHPMEVEVYRRLCGLPLVFRAGPDAGPSQRVEHPCGEVVQAFLETMPSPTDPVTQSDEVFELGPGGEVLQRWWVPVGVTVEGVVDRELIVVGELAAERPSVVHLAVSPGGQFRVVPDADHFQRTSMRCPTSQNLSKSADLECWRLTETSSGTARRIAHEGPCS